MGGKTKKERNYYTQIQKEQNAALSAPTYGENALQQDHANFTAWANSKGRDIRDAPGMSPYIQIGQAAMDRANRDQYGTGAIQLAEGGASGYAQKLKEQSRNELGREVGAGLERAYAARNAEVRGSLLPLAQLELSRKMGQLSNTSQMAQTWIGKPRKSWWDHLASGVQMGSQIGMFGFGG